MQQNNFEENPYPLENLFVGNFQNIKGIVETEEGPIDLDLRGEFSFYGTVEGENFNIQALQRALIVGVPMDPGNPDRIGVLSLGGPPGLAMEVDDNDLSGIPMNLHYRDLSQEDPFSPRIIRTEAQIEWEGISTGKVKDDIVIVEGDDIHIEKVDVLDEATLEGVSVSTAELDENEFVKVVKMVNDVPVNIKLRQATTENLPPLRCLLPDDCDQPLPMDQLRLLDIRFINLTGVNISFDVHNQVNKICDIWGQKAALHINFFGTVDVEEEARGGFDKFRDGDAEKLGEIPDRSLYHIDFVIVNELYVKEGIDSGITYGLGTFDAICIISLSALEGDPLICAHELSHVLNLDHATDPWYSNSDPPPSKGKKHSIADFPYTEVNTEYNRHVFREEDPKISPYFTRAAIVPYCPDP